MTLASLKPRWFITEPGRRGQGISFLCPHCKQVRIGVAFANPMDGGRPDPTTGTGKYINKHVHRTRTFDVPPGGPFWTRTGTSFRTLSLSPSVNASASGHWHGHVIPYTFPITIRQCVRVRSLARARHKRPDHPIIPPGASFVGQLRPL